MIPNSDLQRWQQATKGMGASQSALTQEELSAFQALTEFINSSNFEASESEGYIQVLKNALSQHANNRILKAHLTNFVTLCEKYFNVPVVNPPPIIQISAEITPPQVSKLPVEITLPQAPKTKPKPTEKSKKPRGGSKKTIIIIGSALAVLVILAIGGYFIFKGGNLFSGSTDSETIDYSLIPVSSNGNKWGYIDQKGAYVINPQFDRADFFRGGLAKVASGRIDGGPGDDCPHLRDKINYINKKGEFAIPVTYKGGTAFSGGLAFVVETGGPPTCIDKNGNTRFVLKDAEYVFAFSEGLALFVTEDEKYGFVDRNGNIAIHAQFERAMPFCGGFAIIRQDGKYGFIDKTGRIVINPQFQEVRNFSEGMAAFYDGRQWGYINTKGAYAINPQFDYAGSFSQGMAVVKQGEKYGYINKKGRLVINPQFDYASSFSDGLAAIGNKESGFGYISKDGQIKINPQFGYAGNFYNGIAPVRSSGAFKWGLINKSGQYVVNPQFSDIKSEIPKEYKMFYLGEPYDNHEHFLCGYAGLFNGFDFVQSDYYDASGFVKLFFERESGNTFDGVTASTTLEELSNHPKYGAGLNARGSNYADYNQTISITKEMFIRDISFRFDSAPIYRIIEDIYDNRGRRIDTKKEYDFTATPDAIVYEFLLAGKASNKYSAVVSALKAEIERRYGQTMKKITVAEVYGLLPDDVGEREVYCLFQDNGKLSFAIDGVTLYVAFNKEYLSKQFQESSPPAQESSVQESPVRFVQPKPAVPEEPQVEEATPIHVKY